MRRCPRARPTGDGYGVAGGRPGDAVQDRGRLRHASVARGSVCHRHYRIERNGYDGPIEVRLADRQAHHLQGIHGPTILVPAGANEFDYAVEMPPWMEIGRTARACVMGTGVVKEGGVDHYVSYSSIAQNDQIIAVMETGRLGVEMEKPAIARRGARASPCR